MKQLSEYTKEELIAIGKKTVERRIKEAEKAKETNQLAKNLLAAYKAGKITLPKAGK